MEKKSQKRNQWVGAFLAVFFLSALFYTSTSDGTTEAPVAERMLLQGTLHLKPELSSEAAINQPIQPGTAVKFEAIVENIGNSLSSEGSIFVRYAFSKPMHKENGSVIFQTEEKPLPPIEPGKSATILFDKTHATPSILDFVRNDWALREYQIVVKIDGQEKVIGSSAITFSAYYYPGVMKQLQAEFTTSQNP